MHSLCYFELPVGPDQFLRGSLHSTNNSDSPFFVFSHGFTSHRMGPGYLFVKLSKALANVGCSSLRFDFRGSGESDGKFCEMNVSTMKDDLLSVLLWIKKFHHPSRIFLLGHSLGGMIASLCSSEAQGVILLSAVANPMALIHKQNEMILAGPNKDGFYEHGPHEMSCSFAKYLNTDPVKALSDSLHGPLLLIHGDADQSISPMESERYFSETRKRGIDSQYHILKGADHNYSRVADVKLLCEILTNWTKEHSRE